MARAAVGDASGAFAAFDAFLNNGYETTRGWAQQLYWNKGVLVGSDPLNNALLSLWGLLRGGLGILTTLSQGLVRTTPPAPQLEGARYTFGYLGADVCVTVTNGSLLYC